MNIIELIEYKPKLISPHKLPEEIIDIIETKYKTKIKVNFKRIKGKYKIELISQGWVGFIPLNSNFALRINPKVSIKNLLGMLNYTLNLKSFNFLEGISNCESLNDLCDRLAQSLSVKILNRSQKGLYATYINCENELTKIKGKINLKKIIYKPYNIKLNCQYQKYIKDIEDNQILLWTLRCMSRSKFFSKNVYFLIKKAYHTLQNYISLKEFFPQQCINRKYNRLNQDYEIMHILCYFFLQHISPTHHQGTENTLPFLVNMAQLYEEFVAKWLKQNLPSKFKAKTHDIIKINDNLKFNIDLVISEKETDKNYYVLDTKYKTKFNPSDFHQIVSYATQKYCKNAILIYPQPLQKPLNVNSADINIRSLTFALDQDLEIAGTNFLESLFLTENLN